MASKQNIELRAGNTNVAITPMGSIILEPSREVKRVGDHYVFIDNLHMYTIGVKGTINRLYVGRTSIHATNINDSGEYEIILKNRFGDVDLLRSKGQRWEKR